MRPLTPRERRLLALGLLLVVIGVGWLAVIQPVIGGFFARAAERRDLEAALIRDDRIVAALPAWRKTAEAQRRASARFAVIAPSDTLAVEAMKERIERLAADEGFTVGAIDDLQADAPPGAVKLRVDMTLSLTQLSDTLRRLENEGAYVVVDYLSVSADQAVITGRLAPMAVRLELSAAYRPAGPHAP